MQGCVSYENYTPDDGMNQVGITGGVFTPHILVPENGRKRGFG